MNRGFLVNGRWSEGVGFRDIRSPYSGEVVGGYAEAGEVDVDEALRSMAESAATMRQMPSCRRAEILLGIRDLLSTRKEEMARQITLEAAKPISDSRVEVERALNVLTLGAEESKRIHGEVLPLDLLPASAGRWGITRRFPIGPVVGISPFNFPLNLGLHKVAPALAAGCPITWKPSLLTPGPALLLAEMAAEAGVPPGALNVLTPPDALAEKLATDERVRMLSFTGSARVGWSLRAKAGSKKVALELGGNAAVLIAADADLDHAVKRCAIGGFTYAGQVCISTQRILVEDSAYDGFLSRFLPAVKEIRVGDPLDESTRMGPMISEKESARVESWIGEAVEQGARILTGGHRDGLMWEPTVLENVPRECSISCQEAFGPVVIVSRFHDWEEALARVNDSVYGLQAGVFTRDLDRAMRAFHTLEVGGVILNDVPSYRMDSMPYGGVKQSGLGREGLRYAIEEMTEPRICVFSNL